LFVQILLDFPMTLPQGDRHLFTPLHSRCVPFNIGEHDSSQLAVVEHAVWLIPFKDK